MVSIGFGNWVRWEWEKLWDLGDVPEGINGRAGLMLNQALMKELPLHEDCSVRQLNTKAEVAGNVSGSSPDKSGVSVCLTGNECTLVIFRMSKKALEFPSAVKIPRVALQEVL